MIPKESVFRLASLALKFARVNRITFHEDGVRPETDTDHTFMLGLIACAIAAEYYPELNLGKVARYALVHDLVEAHAGDTPSFNMTVETKADKVLREEKAFGQIQTDFADSFPWVVREISEYESQTHPEARFVRYLDKALPKLTHILNGGVTLRNLKATKATVEESHRAQLDALGNEFPECKELLHALMVETSESCRLYEG